MVLSGPFYRGSGRLRIALVGQPNSGKTTLFHAVSSTSVDHGQLAGTDKAYQRCTVQIGLDEVELVDLPAFHSLQNLRGDDLEGLKYLLWGDSRPLISAHEGTEPPAPFSRPDMLIHIVDASTLLRHLELTLELIELGLPIVMGLNMMDEARRKGVQIDVALLEKELGIPVVPMTAIKGHGIARLFERAVQAVRDKACPLPQPSGEHLTTWGLQIGAAVDVPEIRRAFNVPRPFLIRQMKQADDYFCSELACHFPAASRAVQEIRIAADEALPRPLSEEVAADYHHRAAALFGRVAQLTHRSKTITWEDRLDAIFLHPSWGLLGSLGMFALVLFVVFEVSSGIDAATSAKLAEFVAQWEPVSTVGVIGRAVADGLVGLIGIVVPYMLPLVLMLVLLEESGVMQRVAFVVDRFFHYIGLHGKVAVPFLLGLGCNVPAIAATKSVVSGRDRVVASLLITFVPCSARSAIILALGGKYLGGIGIFGIFMLNLLIIALLGKLLVKRYPDISPGLIQEIPAYAIPKIKPVLHVTWQRTQDILTIVTPLLVGGSIVLALLHHVGADIWINQALTPISVWALGLPVVLGVPILFGVLRKELSLLMIYQALGTFDVGSVLDWVQISTFLIFLMFYVPCVSTFAVMIRVIGRREALFSLALSIGVALIVSLTVRLLLEAGRVVF
ncbi:MAG: ferrous iron transport protein B [Zetaproteobacteria bacterium CG12_big_fil_rev_8_21_14_0_65_55_1124]|nr:MAG: ferrous iron transport protein B [Zetaproteobacteria bacterium CG08_land_8_20_14_0_20_55_17]PIW42736.1 MAG: ferrous iron transport protein B [Zetaproteobacteria bacterium CG12_big_fil_rev_8_21_14_0_65_55_1124]PIY53749.1 MAG: ferrous iron transport protein B [Zetaproteobacteria bacterium CG_4_10_14_0_8_um_filter_55_43]PIZ38841.1 MAG: ferrous iron transport protein B [Zetaproteobacteria bacterium CG_4_10_14_0_2_um_filter_55_20]PJB81468.1 MAG: ferrous iron transport protein B [Zetaproteoba